MFLVPYNKLTNEQKSIIQRVSRGFDNLFVEGPPGAGKTLISLYAVRDIVNNSFSQPLVLMYNHSLYGYLKSSFNALGIYDNMTIATKDKFFWDLAGDYGIYPNRDDDYETKYKYLLRGLLEENLSQKWSIAIVDEVQDFWADEWKILKKLAGNIISMGDFNQRVYNTDLSRQMVTGNSQVEKLTDIFRFHKNIAKVAGQFTRTPDNIETKVTKIEQKQPKIIDVAHRSREADEVSNILRALRNHGKRIGIIAPERSRLKELHEELENMGIETTFFNSNKDYRSYDFNSNTPLLITAHSAKGLEFENVLVLGFYNNIGDRYMRELDELIYVSLTRANSGLYIIRTNDTVKKLKDLQIEEEKKTEVDLDALFG